MKMHPNHGQSITQVLVAMTLMAILAVIFTKMNSDASKGQNNVRMQHDINNFSTVLSLLLHSSTNCDANIPSNLSSSTFNSSALPVVIPLSALKYLDNSILVAPGASIASGLNVTSLQLNIEKEIRVGSVYQASVEIKTAKAAGSVLGPSNASAKTSITVYTHPTVGTTLEIDGCGSSVLSGWQDVSLSDTTDFDPRCMYRMKVQVPAGSANALWMGATTIWNHTSYQSTKYLGVVLSPLNEMFGIRSLAKNIYGHTNTSGTFVSEPTVTMLLLQKSCY